MPLFSPMFTSDVRADGKIAIITGANTGIGKETACDLYKRGARVIIAVRTISKGEAAKEQIEKNASAENASGVGSLEVLHLDLQSLESVRNFAAGVNEKFDKIDLLINNAGIMACPRAETQDGFESQLGVNHLAHFLLTHLLLDKIKAAAPSRIVNLSSVGHKLGSMHFDDLMLKYGYSPWGAYGQSKLANILFSRELAARLKDSGVTVYAVHPGSVNTELYRSLPLWQWIFIKPFVAFTKTPVQGAQTSLYCALHPDLQKVSGRYYSDCRETTPSQAAQNDDDARKLWEMSEKLVGIAT